MTSERWLVQAVRRARRGRRGTAVRFGDQIREVAGRLARERRGTRGAVKALAGELGLTYDTLRRWSEEVSVAGIRPVRVAGEEPVPTRASVLVLAEGIRVEGLSVVEVVELVRRLR